MMTLVKLSLLLGLVSVGLTIAVLFLSYTLFKCEEHSLQKASDSVPPTPSALMSTTTASFTEPWEKDFRLSPFVRPIHYDVLLHPDLDTGFFHGETLITANVSRKMDYIYLHIEKLNITKSSVLQNGVEIPIKKTFAYPRHQYWIIQLERDLEIGECSLKLFAEGSLRKQDIVGFYESRYTMPGGENRRIATSKFEPTYARQAFPCFDEPNMKAKFSVKLVKPKEKYIALSNVNPKKVIDDSPSEGLSTVEFETTVPMSTYLVCFIVCDFQHLPSQNSSQGFPIKVYAREGQLENMKYALNIAIKSINFYIDYFKVKYPLPKLDLIAIPDFVSGAMEHWGLVTFREASVLFKEGSSSVVNRKRVAMTTSHELAHMWFGDLVTMDWWNDLWLNEGFASYMQYKALAVVEPTWEVDTLFLTDNLHSTLQLDQTLSSHPIVQTVSNPDQITEIFDVISYQKGSSVIRMLENMMGNDNFAKGVTSYLREFQFRNAETNDLWNHLQKYADNLSVTNVMDTYTRQMGFPLITVKRSGNSVTFTQSRYLSTSKAKFNVDESPYKYTWDVFITLISSGSPAEEQKVWLYRNASEVTLNVPADTTWIKVNKFQLGYYRVNYDLDTWEAIIEQLKKDHTVFDARDRSNILDDSFSLADSQLVEYSLVFRITEYLTKEEHHVPWSVMYTKLSRLDDRLFGTSGQEDFRKYIRCLLKSRVAEETWDIKETDSFLQINAKLVINDLACSFAVPTCLKKAEDLMKVWFDTGEKPNANLRGLVYRYGMENVESEKEWNIMWLKYKEETNPQEQIKMMGGLASVKNTKLLEKFLEMAKDEKNIRSQDYFTTIALVAGNPNGLPVAWNYLKSNWDYLVKRFGLNHRVFGRIIPSVAGKFTSETQLEEVKEFFKQHQEAGAGAAGRKQALEMISNNIKWVNNQGKKLQDWVKDHVNC